MEEPDGNSPRDTIFEKLEKGATIRERAGEYEIVQWDEGEPAK